MHEDRQMLTVAISRHQHSLSVVVVCHNGFGSSSFPCLVLCLSSGRYLKCNIETYLK